MKKIILLFICVYFPISCAQTIVEPEGTGNIIGTVADKTTGEFVPTVNLSISSLGNKTVTGSDGSFQFANLAPGSYTIDLQKEGYKLESYTAVVFSGKNTELHLLIERIPAIITADRDVLEFGDNMGVTQLSVGIINSGYLDLHWSVSWDNTVKWIKEIVGQDGKSEGTLKFGKTASLIVRIDREALANGYNEANVVIWSDNGRSELKITAIGADRRMATTNVLPATNVQTTSATLNAEVTSVGSPEYTERGFAISSTEFSDDSPIGGLRTISAPVNKSSAYSAEVSGLSKGIQYFVRAYAKNSIGTRLSSNYVAFTTIGAITEVKTNAVSSIDVINGKAQFNGEISVAGNPSYTEKGFCYNTSGEPTTSSNKITVSGNGAGVFYYSCAGLSSNMTYYVRAYVVQNGNTIYGSTENFSTSILTTEVTTSAATNVTSSSASMNGAISRAGSPMYTERGFCYTTGNTPTISSTKAVVSGNEEGNFSAQIEGLDCNKSYHFRAYAIQNGNPIYGDILSFKTNYKETNVITSAATNIGLTTATLNGSISNIGDPAYTERGFCYTNEYEYPPTISSTKVVVSGNEGGNYSTQIGGLDYNNNYYFRAYVIQNGNPVYGKILSFKTKYTEANVETNIASSIGYTSITLNGRILSIGEPKISERGFCYNSATDLQWNPDRLSIYDNAVIVNGIESGPYSTSINNLPEGTSYYYRAYVIQDGDVKYGDVEKVTTETSPKVLTGPVIDAVADDYVYGHVTIQGAFADNGSKPITEVGFVYGRKDNPTISTGAKVEFDEITSLINTQYQYRIRKNLTKLDRYSKYYYRIYVKTSVDYTYGETYTIYID